MPKVTHPQRPLLNKAYDPLRDEVEDYSKSEDDDSEIEENVKLPHLVGESSDEGTDGQYDDSDLALELGRMQEEEHAAASIAAKNEYDDTIQKGIGSNDITTLRAATNQDWRMMGLNAKDVIKSLKRYAAKDDEHRPDAHKARRGSALKGQEGGARDNLSESSQRQGAGTSPRGG